MTDPGPMPGRQFDVFLGPVLSWVGVARPLRPVGWEAVAGEPSHGVPALVLPQVVVTHVTQRMSHAVSSTSTCCSANSTSVRRVVSSGVRVSVAVVTQGPCDAPRSPTHPHQVPPHGEPRALLGPPPC